MPALLILLLACGPSLPPATRAERALDLPGVAQWPARTAPLSPPPFAAPDGFGVRRVYVDAGHGTGDNTGTRTAWCEHEADVTLDLAEDLARRLEETGAFDVRVSREHDAGPSYAARLDEATAWDADALLSLHLDARGDAWSWSPAPGATCWRNEDIPGFSVLVADRGDAALVERRVGLARSIASHLGAAGFRPYDWGYGDTYDSDPTAGVYLDRRVLFMLRRPTMPSVIVETHHGLDLEERARWQEERTRAAFAAAVALALVESLQDAVR
jgi:N-acetylmuramoyl-L-alanine amidase